MVLYVAAVLVEYAIAFGLALLLNSEIRGRKFFRVAFLLPLMLSPVAVSWMVGKSMMEIRFGPLARLARLLGWSSPAFFSSPGMAKLSIMAMDAWTFIPFMMIMLLAGLQALPKDILEAAKIDGATGWQSFWKVIFPLMLPVSITAVVIRIIFKLKIADIIINVTSGGPGGATDSVTSFIYPRISRPLECRLRHASRHGLSGDHRDRGDAFPERPQPPRTGRELMSGRIEAGAGT